MEKQDTFDKILAVTSQGTEQPELSAAVIEFLINLTKADIKVVKSSDMLCHLESLQNTLEIYQLKGSDRFWIRHCSICLPWECIEQVVMILEDLGITRENSDFTSTFCADDFEKRYGVFTEGNNATSKAANKILNS